MSVETNAACDICERPRGYANHWHAYSKTALATGQLKIYAWTREGAVYDGSLCGEECAHKLLGRYLSGEASPSNEPKGEHHG